MTATYSFTLILYKLFFFLLYSETQAGICRKSIRLQCYMSYIGMEDRA